MVRTQRSRSTSLAFEPNHQASQRRMRVPRVPDGSGIYISEGFDSTEQGERKELGSDDPRVNVPSLVASFVMNPPRGSFITPTQDS